MKFYNAVEMRELSLTPATYRDALVDVLSPILACIEAPTYTVTVNVSDYLTADAVQIKNDLIQLGYSVDDSTTPGSWVITW